MASLFSFLLVSFACLLALPVAVFFIEIIAAISLEPRRVSNKSKHEPRPKVAVVIPAHNESSGILPTIQDIKLQLNKGDRLLVVADNCVDDTASVAENAGAETIKRDDSGRIGKGYALDFGLQHLRQDPPAVVVFIDADCRISEDALDQLASTCVTTQRPVQGLDLMIAPDESQLNYRVAEFAWRVKNWVRPLGLQKLRLPCQLMGTGMAFPWDVLCSANIATGSIVEDLKLGLDLTQIGYPPLFCPTASVLSYFPSSVEGATSQRKRWETGHLRMIFSATPQLIFTAIAKRNLALFVLALDLAVPPLSVLVIVLTVALIVGGLMALFGFSPAPLVISLISLIATVVAMFFAWLKYGRDLVPPRAFFSLARYIFSKIAIYSHMLFGRDGSQWTRADRKKGE